MQHNKLGELFNSIEKHNIPLKIHKCLSNLKTKEEFY